MKGLLVEILTGAYSNKVSFENLILVGDGVPEVFEADSKAPAVMIVRGNLPGTLKAILVEGVYSPAAFVCAGTAGINWPMFSGAFIFSSDSRFREITGGHPVPLHNRYEIGG